MGLERLNLSSFVKDMINRSKYEPKLKRDEKAKEREHDLKIWGLKSKTLKT